MAAFTHPQLKHTVLNSSNADLLCASFSRKLITKLDKSLMFEISSSHGGEYESESESSGTYCRVLN
jgi:hypothetical protein